MINNLNIKKELNQNGYFIIRGLIKSDVTSIIRKRLIEKVNEVSNNFLNKKDLRKKEVHLLERNARKNFNSIKLQENFRKLNKLYNIKELWEEFYANKKVIGYVRPFINDDILLKFTSAFLKPAIIGGETPWHQDIALWNDKDSSAISAWVAIDPATKENGCLQMVPGSHKNNIIEHILYNDSIHPELPRHMCNELNYHYIELQPGDCVFWHSHMWHYSPPNNSENDRIGCAVVWTNQKDLKNNENREYYWVMRSGKIKPTPEKF